MLFQKTQSTKVGDVVNTMSSILNTHEVVGWCVCLVRYKCVEGEVGLQVMEWGGGEEHKTSHVSGGTRVLSSFVTAIEIT